MRTSRQVLMLACICMFATIGYAQPKTTPAWSAKFKSQVNWQRVHSLGYLIVSTKEGLYGVNPSDGKILWENKNYPNLNPDQFQEVPGTEFVTIAFMTEKSSSIPMQAIIEVAEGKVLFDSQKEQIGVLSRHVLPKSGRLLIIGARPNTLAASLFMYDIASGSRLWANDELFKAEASSKGLLGKLQAMGQQLSGLQSLTSEPVELADQTMIITHPNFVIKLNSGDGKVIWKNAIQASKRGQVYFSSFKKDVVYIGTDVESETGSGFSTTSSSSASKEPQKFYYNIYYAFNLQSDTLQVNLDLLSTMKENNLLGRVLVSQDSGWYNVGEPKGGNFKPYTCIATQFIPLLRKNGFTTAELDLLFKTNPGNAFAIKVRTL